MSTRQRTSALLLSAAMVAAVLAAPAADAAPSAAAGCGDSSFSGESAFVTLQPGDTASFSVFFANTGTCTWTVGTSTQVNLAQGLPLGSASPNSCWGVGWLSATAYATTTQTSVAPGGIGTFAYQIKAPANVPPGSYRFDGDLVLAATGQALNPQGYFQVATVPQPAGTTILGGKITAEATGAAVENVSVQIHESSVAQAGSYMPFTVTSTDTCGYYRKAVPANSYRVGFFPPAAATNLHFKYHQNALLVFAASDVTLASGTTTIVNAALSPVLTITGSTKTGAGTAVANVSVFVTDANQACNGPQAGCGNFGNATSDAAGNFTARVPRGEFYLSFRPPAGLGLGWESWKNKSAPPLDKVSTLLGNATGIDHVFRPTVNGRVSAPGGSALGEVVGVGVYVNSAGTCVLIGSEFAYPSENGQWAIPLNTSPIAILYVEVKPFAGSTLPTKWWQNSTSCAAATPISWAGTSVGNINVTLP